MWPSGELTSFKVFLSPANSRVISPSSNFDTTIWHVSYFFSLNRKSMELRESKNQETADWLRSYQMRSQAMKKSVALHAKFQDPHSSLKDVLNENLKRHQFVLLTFDIAIIMLSHPLTTCCRNWNCFLLAERPIRGEWENTRGNCMTWRPELVNALICLNRWSRWEPKSYSITYN